MKIKGVAVMKKMSNKKTNHAITMVIIYVVLIVITVNTTCAVVSDEGKEELQEILSEDEYEMITAASEFKIRWFFFGDHASGKSAEEK